MHERGDREGAWHMVIDPTMQMVLGGIGGIVVGCMVVCVVAYLASRR